MQILKEIKINNDDTKDKLPSFCKNKIIHKEYIFHWEKNFKKKYNGTQNQRKSFDETKKSKKSKLIKCKFKTSQYYLIKSIYYYKSNLKQYFLKSLYVSFNIECIKKLCHSLLYSSQFCRNNFWIPFFHKLSKIFTLNYN